MNSNRVTVEQQDRMGLRRAQYKVIDPPAVTEHKEHIIPDRRPRPAEMPHPVADLAVTPTATAHIDMKTSAQDRAWGFLIASTPRTFVFSLAITLVSMLATDIGVIAGIVMLISIFSVVELISYAFTLAISAEGTANYEARMKWAMLRTEQRERWKHYNRIISSKKEN